MGEGRDDDETPIPDEDPIQEWLAMVETNEMFEEFGDLGDALGGPPPSLGPVAAARAPMIIDTDAGGAPDDSVALIAAARGVPELALVVTTDEYGGQRARFARHLLDLAGRSDVPVVAGAALGNTRSFVVGGLVPDDVPEQSGEVAEAVAKVCASTPAAVRWVGMGPMSNLARLQETRPELVAKMVVTQLAGAIDPNAPAEHNLLTDPDAVIRMLPVLELSVPSFVVADVTGDPATKLVPDAPIYRKWTAAAAPPWAPVLRAQCDRWTEQHPESTQYDALTLAAAVFWPGVRFGRERVSIGPDARMKRDGNGVEIAMAISADYPAYLRWVDRLVT
ncbi:nucleoside hydrolase [Kribbella sp. CA-253562]|uniref:nucleoside hydrolase n=1 Tax=Kribbella sp. CA-253562 TaxID=3239942 RepID=UPI003D8A8D2B